ncbi:hypothetical protein K0M31_003012, partial [Melipona bicolor]
MSGNADISFKETVSLTARRKFAQKVAKGIPPSARLCTRAEKEREGGGWDVTTDIFRRDYNRRKNRYNGDVKGVEKREDGDARKQAWPKKKKTRKEEERIKLQDEEEVVEGLKNRGGQRAVCTAPIHQPHGSILRADQQTAASHFIVHPHQQCLPRIRLGGADPGHGNNSAFVAIRFQRS